MPANRWPPHCMIVHHCTACRPLFVLFFNGFIIECFRQTEVSGPSHVASNWWIVMILNVNNASLNAKNNVCVLGGGILEPYEGRKGD